MGKSKTWIIITLLLAILTGLLVFRYLSRLQGESSEAMTTEVIARTKITAGTKITPDMVEVSEVPLKYAHPAAATAVQAVVGSYALADIFPGESILINRVGAEDTVTELPYRIPPGLRAMTVPVDNLTGVAGLLKPGHRVDVLVTYSGDDPVLDAKVVTLVQDVLVLAVGRDLLGSTEGEAFENVTLALTPSDAELVALGEYVGRIKLAARSVGDTGKPYLPYMDVDRVLRLFP